MNTETNLYGKYPILKDMRNVIETDLQQTIYRTFPEMYLPLQKMIEYHMGWLDDRSIGKRIRPLLVLLVTSASGGNWMKAIPAASAIELIHNFSLIHDDIQDQSDTRHNRQTLWKREGIAKAINAGDSLFTIGLRKVWELEDNYPLDLVRKVYLILNQTCLRLTQGQFLDLAFENKSSITTDDYLEMIGGKTNALITASTQIGALLGSIDPQTEIYFSSYGHNLGLAFQIMDDYLGIWGDEEITGKPIATDLIAKKKSFPIIFGLESENPFHDLWQSGPINKNNAINASKLLAETGAKESTLSLINKYSQNGLLELALVCGESNPYYSLLVDLTNWLLTRKV